ncbi:MAG TPA: hypothetical protein PKA64_03875 [Myxococcota bacterium]|nr:hypothetical protein [Myxococcota bacterium]
MTPRLIPYTLFRRLVPGLLGGAASLIGWWFAILVISRYEAWYFVSDAPGKESPLWSPEAEGAFLIAMIASSATWAQVMMEGRFERDPLWRRVIGAGWAAFWTAFGTIVMSMAYHAFAAWLGRPTATMALRWRMWPWMFAGVSAMGALMGNRLGRWAFNLIQRRFKFQIIAPPPPSREPRALTAFVHLLAGPATGGLAAVTWYALGPWFKEQYHPMMVAAWVFGFSSATFGWAIPEHLFRGWVVVRYGARPGWRVPVDPHTPELAERFIGSFPVGLDLHLPASDEVDLLHLSVLATDDGEWAARGLSQRTVRVIRPLERIDLAFDPSLPAPLETPLRHEDRVRLGRRTELEFVVLPTEGSP